MAIALGHRRVAVDRQIRCGMAHGVDQAEPDDVPGLFVARRLMSNVTAGRLNRLDDRPGRIEQRPIPVENH